MSKPSNGRESKYNFAEEIAAGIAVDASVNTDDVRKYIAEQIGWMQEVSNIDEIIDQATAYCQELGVVLYADLSMFLVRWQMRQLPRYLRILVEEAKADLQAQEEGVL